MTKRNRQLLLACSGAMLGFATIGFITLGGYSNGFQGAFAVASVAAVGWAIILWGFWLEI